MSFEAKVTFMNRFRRQLESHFAVPEVGLVMNILTDNLNDVELSVKMDGYGQDNDLLGAYISALQIQGRSTKTIDRYRYIIGRTLNYISIPVSEITVYHLRGYLSKEKDRGISDSTLDGYRQIYSAFFNWMQREGLIVKNPTVNLGKIKYRKKIKTAYTDTDIERLKLNCKTTRDRAIVTFLLSTGCRISEMTQLDIPDVDLQNHECTVLGKGNKERTVYLDSVAVMTLSDYLKERVDSEKALFVSLRKNAARLQPGGVRIMLRKLGILAKVDHVHPHKFRRTRATNLIKHGMPIQEVAAILGHEKLDTTMEYVVMDKSGIKNSYQMHT